MVDGMRVRRAHRGVGSPSGVGDDRHDDLTESDEERWATDGGRTINTRNQLWETTRHVHSHPRSGFGVGAR